MGNLANIVVQPCKLIWDGEDFGFTEGDIEASVTEAGVDVTAHQEGTNVLDMIRTGKSAELSITLKEAGTARLSTLLGAGGATSTPAAEVSAITIPTAAVAGINSKYFDINAALDATLYRVWFDVNNTGTAPAAGGRTLVEVDLDATPTVAEIAAALQTELDGLADFTATEDGETVTVTNAATGACTDVADGNTGFEFEVTTQGIGAVVGWGSSKDFSGMLANAKKLVLHPIANADDVLTDDLAFWKAYPVIESIVQSGENPKTITLSWKIFPDLTRAPEVRLFVLGDHR